MAPHIVDEGTAAAQRTGHPPRGPIRIVTSKQGEQTAGSAQALAATLTLARCHWGEPHQLPGPPQGPALPGCAPGRWAGNGRGPSQAPLTAHLTSRQIDKARLTSVAMGGNAA